ncbi:hypothetical protein BDD12DRAFT_810080 [Trichophaea hybrida]|nr:hypothetical protein BDD12DRAFT_810080 [Trichophaea hybrida]
MPIGSLELSYSDPLSLAASIAGLLALGGKVVSSLTVFVSSVNSAPNIVIHIRNETESLTAIFEQLQNILLQRTFPHVGRTSKVPVDHLVVMLTSCVVAFTELEAELDGLDAVDEIGWWERIKWTQKEPTLKTIVDKLAVHKSSLNLMLTVLLCQLNSVAEVAMDQMRAQVERLVRANERLLSLVERTKLEETPGNSAYQADDSVSTIRPESVAAGRTVSSRKGGIATTQSFHSGFEETQNFTYQEDDNLYFQPEDNDAETIRPNASRTNPESAIPQMILFSGYLQYSLDAYSKISPQFGFIMIGEVGAGAGDILQHSGEDWYGKEFRRSYGNSAVNLQIMDTNDANDPFQAYRDSTFRKSELFLYVFRADGDLKTSFTFLEMKRHVAMIKRAKEELIYLHPISFPSCTIIIFHNQNALPGAEEYAEQIRQWAKEEECDFVTGDIHDPAVVNELFLRLVKPYKAYTEEIKKQREEEWEKKLEQQRRRQEQWEKRVVEQRKKGSIWVRKLFRVNH